MFEDRRVTCISAIVFIAGSEIFTRFGQKIGVHVYNFVTEELTVILFLRTTALRMIARCKRLIT